MIHLAYSLVILTATALAEPSNVTVDVTLRTESGQPLDGVFLVIHAPSNAAYGFTDENGKLVRTVTPGADDDEIHVFLRTAVGLDVTPEEAVQAFERYESLRSQYYFQRTYSITIEPEMNEASIEIIARPAIKVTGKITSPEPKWELDDVSIFVRDGIWTGRFEPLEQFEVHGVRKGATAELFVLLYEESAIRSIHLTTEQTQDDVALGEISFPVIGSGAIVDIGVTDAENLWQPGGMGSLWEHITLISLDGETILTYGVDPESNKAVANLATVQPYESPSIPPGIYYVSRGLFGGRIQLMLLDMVRDGAHTLLATAGVPLLTAQEGDGNELTLDAKQTRDAILAAYEVWSNQ